MALCHRDDLWPALIGTGGGERLNNMTTILRLVGLCLKEAWLLGPHDHSVDGSLGIVIPDGI